MDDMMESAGIDGVEIYGVREHYVALSEEGCNFGDDRTAFRTAVSTGCESVCGNTIAKPIFR